MSPNVFNKLRDCFEILDNILIRLPKKYERIVNAGLRQRNPSRRLHLARSVESPALVLQQFVQLVNQLGKLVAILFYRDSLAQDSHLFSLYVGGHV